MLASANKSDGQTLLHGLASATMSLDSDKSGEDSDDSEDGEDKEEEEENEESE